jgi:hypothetical protein
LVSGASVTISGNGQTYTSTTDTVGVFSQGDLQPATYTISVADLEGFKTPDVQEVVVEEDTQNSVIVTYLEKPLLNPVFGENTIQTISAISAEISSKNMTSAEVEATYGWKAGDTIEMPYNSSTLPMRIMGFNHDNKSDGSGKIGITLATTYRLPDSYQIYSRYFSAESGWLGNDWTIRTSTLPNIKSKIGAEWQPFLQQASKLCQNASGNQFTAKESISLFSKSETWDTYTGEGEQYEFWKNGGSKDLGQTVLLRSVTSNQFYTNSGGSASSIRSDRKAYVAFMIYI